jgi:exopolysaccharide production protein ExoQ
LKPTRDDIRPVGRGEGVAATLIVLFAFALANLRAFVFYPLFPETSRLGGLAWFEVALWSIPLALMAWAVAREHFLRIYMAAWRKNWPLILFIGLAVASAAYSVSPGDTLYRTFCLLFASLAGAYIGVRYNLDGLLMLLFCAGAAIVLLSLANVLILPGAGRMIFAPYDGAWRGIFWHKNHLGSVVALLNAVFLFRLIKGFRSHNAQVVVDGALYALSLLLIVQARSAAGLITAILLHIFTAGVLVWLKVQQRLRPAHYLATAAVCMFVLVATFTNQDIVLGLFHRNATLTGRVPLWVYLTEEVVRQRPLLGHGFGALWASEAFRVSTQQAVGWGRFAPLIADNGFLDILLHLGIAGVLLLIVVLAIAIIRSYRYAMARRTLGAFFPLLLLGYGLIANLTFSLFLETESFIWLLIVAVSFILTPGKVAE